MSSIISYFSPVVNMLGLPLTIVFSFLLSAYLILGLLTFTKILKINRTDKLKNDELLTNISEKLNPKVFSRMLSDRSLGILIGAEVDQEKSTVTYRAPKILMRQQSKLENIEEKVHKLDIDFLPDFVTKVVLRFEVNKEIDKQCYLFIKHDNEAIPINKLTKSIEVSLNKSYFNKYIEYIIEFEDDLNENAWKYLEISLLSFKFI